METIKMDSVASASIESLQMDFAEAHNKRLFIHHDTVIDNDKNNINLNFLKSDFFIEKEKTFFIKGGNGKTETIKFQGMDYDKIFSVIKESYKDHTGKTWEQRKGPRVGKSEIFKEMVINTLDRTNKEDLLKLKTNLEKIGITILDMSLHNDEGYIDQELNVKKYNHHLHLIFANCDNNGIVKRWQKKDLSALQTIVAKTLGMERGEYGSKTKRLSAQQYKQYAKDLADKSKLLNKDIRELKKELKETQRVLTLTKSKNKELATFKSRFENASDTIKKLESEKNELQDLFNALGLNEIKQKTQEIKKIKQMLLEKLALEYNQERDKLKQSQQATQKQYQELKKDNENKKELINEAFKKQLTKNVDNSNIKNKNSKDIDIGY